MHLFRIKAAARRQFRLNKPSRVSVGGRWVAPSIQSAAFLLRSSLYDIIQYNN
jgi:hypothetical protein